MNDEQLLRYSRHVFLEGFDIERQQMLLGSSVVIIGAGGLACSAAAYLASSGVGYFTIADDDVVELSNLQRQIAHATSDIGMAKVDSLKQYLEQLNPNINVTALKLRATDEHLPNLIKDADVVLDCSDNFATRFAVNQACVEQNIGLVSGAAIAMQGQLFVRKDNSSPCYRCLFDDAVIGDSASCSETGVLAPVVGIVGSYQALEAIKLLTNFASVQGGVQSFDFSNNKNKLWSMKKDTHCPVCGSL